MTQKRWLSGLLLALAFAGTVAIVYQAKATWAAVSLARRLATDPNLEDNLKWLGAFRVDMERLKAQQVPRPQVPSAPPAPVEGPK